MKKVSFAVLFIFILFGGGMLFAFANDVTIEKIEIGGTIYNNGHGWRILNDKDHEPMNLTSIGQTDSCIEIVHNVNASQVVTWIVTSDEVMAKNGYTVGISGGTKHSFIYIYDKNGNVVKPAKYIKSGANIWIYGILAK
jgi:hypothetical protein